MKKNIFAICMVTAAGCMATLTAQTKGAETLVPLTERVNVQADSARIDQIMNGRWVAVGAKEETRDSAGFYMFVQTASLLPPELRRRTIHWRMRQGRNQRPRRAFLLLCHFGGF